MKTKGLISGATKTVLTGAGAILGQEVNAYAGTIDPMYLSIGKLVAAAVLPVFVKGKSAEHVGSFASGVAAQAALELYASYKSSGTVAGYDSQMTSLAGWDSQAQGLYGLDARPVDAPSSVSYGPATA